MKTLFAFALVMVATGCSKHSLEDVIDANKKAAIRNIPNKAEVLEFTYVPERRPDAIDRPDLLSGGTSLIYRLRGWCYHFKLSSSGRRAHETIRVNCES